MDGWKIISVDDACTITDCQHKTAPIVEYITPYKMLRTSNIRNGKIDTINVNYVTEETYKAWSVRGELNINDVILTREAPMGEVGIIRSEERFFLGQRMLQLKANQKLIQPKYLYLSLLSSYFQKQLAPLKGNGSIVANIRIPELKKMRLLIPSKEEEQQKIASILSTWDKAIELKEKLIEQKKEQKKGLMQKLLTGKIRLPGFEGEWKSYKLNQVLKIRHGKDQKKVQKEDGCYPILGSGGQIGRTDEYLYNKESILIGRKGTIDRPVYMDEPFWTVDTLFYTEINEGFLPKYIYYIFNTIPWKQHNEASGVPSLSATTIGGIKVLVPDYLIQKAYSRILSTADDEIHLLETHLELLKQQKKGLMQLLLTGKVRVKV